MKLKNQHKAYVAVLGLGIAGLAVDRFVLGYSAGPASAAGALVTEESAAAEAALPDGAAQTHLEVVTVAGRVAALAAATGWTGRMSSSVDAFAPPAAWAARIEAEAAAVQAAKAAQAVQSKTAPSAEPDAAPTLRLTAVSGNAGAMVAMISVNGRSSAYRMGDKVGQMTIEGMHRGGVELSGPDNQRVTLGLGRAEPK